MNGENEPLSVSAARHLLRRAEFGATQKALDKLTKKASTRGAAADLLLNFKPTSFRPKSSEPELAHNKWVRYMVRTKNQLQEKLVVFWHDHFATNFSTVRDVALMAEQNRLFRKSCKGNFKDLVKAINKDPAMMDFLDTARNNKEDPNENYGRELMELFTLGVKDFTGQPNYDQEDIVQIARAYTGWRFDRSGKPFLRPGRHDFEAEYPERGPKVVFKNRGGFANASGQSLVTNGEGEAEIDTVIDVLFAHRDSDGQNTVARYVAYRLLTYFAHPDPDLSVVDDVVAASGFDLQFEIEPLLRAIFVHDAFYESSALAPYDAATRKSVKWPIDYVVGTLRQLGMKLKGPYQFVNGGSEEPILDQLNNMGQILFDPPSVFGWDWETGWLSSSTLLARYGFARDVTAARGGGSTSFRPERLIDTSLTDPGAIVDAVGELLGVADQLTAAERDVLIDYLTDGAGPGASVDLEDGDVLDTKLNGLVALVLQSPVYQLH